MSALALIAAAALAPVQPVPASVRVNFDGQRNTPIVASGLADRARGRRVRSDDPVRVASISKLATAIGVMRLVDEGQVSLDRDVSAYLSWPLRNPGFPDVPITLRLLLSHTAGVRDGADYALTLDADLEQWLRKSGAWDTGQRPGRYFSYANLDFPIIAAVMEGATGERFDRLMARLVFRPLRIDACFNWTTCSDGAVARAVVLYRADGSVARDDLRGARPPCPGTPASDGGCDLSSYRLGRNGAFFSPQGGLRIAMPDLAQLGRVLVGTPARFLSPSSLAELIAPQWRYDGSNGDTEGGFYCGYGLGVMLIALPDRPAACRDDPFGDDRPRIGHAGEAYGLRSGLWIDPATRRGTAFFVTAVPDHAPRGTRSAFTAAEEEMIAARTSRER
ncbi:MAG: beta-lactamase family protein [Sphingomonas sp.]|nr:beta-lactamase family protein [Sphingomonas sp.]